MTPLDISILNRNFAKIQMHWIKKTAIDWKELIKPMQLEEFDERAGFLEFCENMDRQKAERKAYIEMAKYYRGKYDNTVANT